MFLDLIHGRMPNHWNNIFGAQANFLKNLDFLDGVPPRYSKAPVNVYNSDKNSLVTVFIPGYSPENIEVTIEENNLIIKGHSDGEKLSEDFVSIRNEIGEKNFLRKLELPFPVDPDKVVALFFNGVLKVNLPKEEILKQTKVQVKIGN